MLLFLFEIFLSVPPLISYLALTIKEHFFKTYVNHSMACINLFTKGNKKQCKTYINFSMLYENFSMPIVLNIMLILNIMLLLNITDGKLQIELIYYYYLFSTVVSINSCVFLSFRPFIVMTTFSTGTQLLNGTTIET